MFVMNGRDSKKHENNCLRRSTKHFHGIFQSGLRFGRDISLNIILHGDAAKSDPSDTKHYSYLRGQLREFKFLMYFCL